MKNTLYVNFVTSNDRKVGEARMACAPAGISIVKTPLHIVEIQSPNASEVTLNKAKQAYEQLNKPLVVTDTSWSIPALKGFPGPYMKDIANWLRSEDFVLLMNDKDNRTISFSENITYIDKHGTKSFVKEFSGRIVKKPRGSGNSIENVAEFDGVTLGERREQGGFSHKPEDYVWIEFANWFKEYNNKTS